MATQSRAAPSDCGSSFWSHSAMTRICNPAPRCQHLHPRGKSSFDIRTTAKRVGRKIACRARTFFRSMSNKDLSPGRWTFTTTRSPSIWAKCTCADGIGCGSEGAAAGWPQQWAADQTTRTSLRSALRGSAPRSPWPDANRKLARCPAQTVAHSQATLVQANSRLLSTGEQEVVRT